jgi:hypothetical protein
MRQTAMRDPRWNGLKHGLRSQVQVLPWEDAEEFAAMRQEMYETFRPKTGNEARCVEAMVNHEWCMERCRRVREEYHDKMTAVLHGDRRAGEHCEGDPHRWHHKALDCTLEEGRLQRNQERERRKLTELQRLRRLRLVEEADVELPMVEPVLPAMDAVTPSEARNENASGTETTLSGDEEIGNSSDRIVEAPEAKPAGSVRQSDSSPWPSPHREFHGTDAPHLANGPG